MPAGARLLGKVVLEGVSKTFGEVTAVHALDLSVEAQEFVALVGPSGCGKSTTLRMIAGLEEATQGLISIDGVVVNDLPPRERNIAMVFQNYALYPHMTVRENLSFGLKLVKTPGEEIEARVAEAAAVLGLEDKLNRRPSQLSGGERQRVAMGRAMVRRPKVFLFDEPLSSLDAKLRTTMRTEIKRLHRRLRTTVIYVTHDQVEAMTLADRIVIMRDGRVEQIGTPAAVFGEPANRFVAGFIGSPPMNFVTTVVEQGGALRIGEATRVPLPLDRFPALEPGRSAILGVRAEDLVPRGHGQEPNRSFDYAAPVSFAEPLGSETLLVTELGGQEVIAKMFRPVPVAAGQRLSFKMNLDGMHLFDPQSGASLARACPEPVPATGSAGKGSGA
jgi:multiple sugar transport system ATP-binding protein